MSDITISPVAQLAIVGALLALVAAALAAQAPELQRYMKMRNM